MDRSLPARRVGEALEMLLLARGTPQAIVCDNGPEFVNLVPDQRAAPRGITLASTGPGRPVESCFTKGFSDELRDYCFNQHYFATRISPAQ